MKLKLVAAIFVFVAIPAVAYGQQAAVPKPTKADVQKVVQIVSSDKAKLQAYCDVKKLYDQMGAAYQKNDSKTADALGKQADALANKVGPEYSKMMDGLEQVDQNSSEGKEFMSILSGLDRLCAGPAPNPLNLRRFSLPLPNLHPFNPRQLNLHRLSLRRREPAPKSGQHAHKLVLFPTVPIWELGS
jgi:hypothetical protein